MVKRVLTSIITVTLLMGALVACGGSDGSSQCLSLNQTQTLENQISNFFTADAKLQTLVRLYGTDYNGTRYNTNEQAIRMEIRFLGAAISLMPSYCDQSAQNIVDGIKAGMRKVKSGWEDGLRAYIKDSGNLDATAEAERADAKITEGLRMMRNSICNSSFANVIGSC
tara:strand:+ start:119 stop:622 length:504 start_codon:yes stop_codon:yes gene_type:complete